MSAAAARAPSAPADAGLVGDALRDLLDVAAVGTLLPTVIHGGNNRLTVILACLDLLQAAELDNADLREAVALATGAAQQLASDFSTLLAGARGKAPPAQACELADPVARALRLDAFLHPAPLPHACVVAPGLVLQVERGRLEAALLRVCAAARRAGATALRVRGEAVEVAARLPERPALRKGRYCRLALEFDGATLPALWTRGLTDAPHVVERLEEPDGLDRAAFGAFVAGLRGCYEVHALPTGTRVELHLPAVPGRE